MSRSRLALRQMLKGNSIRLSRGSSPPGSEDEVNFAIGQHVTFALTKHDDLLKLGDNERSPEHTIATFRSNGKSVVLSPLVPVCMRSPSQATTSTLTEQEPLDIPASTSTQANFIYLRVGDTVDFPSHKCKIMLVFQDAQASSAIEPTDVQVKSSNVDLDDGKDQIHDDVTEDEDDLDMWLLGRTPTPFPIPSPLAPPSPAVILAVLFGVVLVTISAEDTGGGSRDRGQHAGRGTIIGYGSEMSKRGDRR
ncbi:hypothetical protein B0A48_08600 [Cryoendolithus antarcticus]|uniref:Uncharacterized protein n=1 Tax=Cryoendolithus antarcticus TaxID=1507870 RepID=A0A1V8T6K9_9PEZI|nr:hypothetical protein B0A48_08600 [Cryoendolithus antarcticus]